jgi:hypothetical protein
MKIEILEDEIKLNIDGKLVRYEKGDVVNVRDDIGASCCALGWANDVSGVVKTGERKPGAGAPLVPDNLLQDVSAK